MENKRLLKQLSEKELQQMSEAIQKIRAFINKMELIHGDGEIDKELMNGMMHLLRNIHVISLALEDTILAHRHHAYMRALEICQYVKKAAEMNVPGAEAIYHDLSASLKEAQKEQANKNTFWAPKHDN